MKCLPNIGQIHDQEGKTWGIESGIAALQHEPVKPEEGEYLPSSSHHTAASSYGELWGNFENTGLQTPRQLCCAVLSPSVLSNSLWPHGLQPARLLCLWNSSGKNTRVGIHSLLQGIFQTQGSNPGLLHCRRIPYRLSHQGSPQIAEVHIKEIILMIPDSCIFLYLEKYYIPLIWNAASWIWRSVFLKSTSVK